MVVGKVTNKVRVIQNIRYFTHIKVDFLHVALETTACHVMVPEVREGGFDNIELGDHGRSILC